MIKLPQHIRREGGNECCWKKFYHEPKLNRELLKKGEDKYFNLKQLHQLVLFRSNVKEQRMVAFSIQVPVNEVGKKVRVEDHQTEKMGDLAKTVYVPKIWT